MRRPAEIEMPRPRVSGIPSRYGASTPDGITSGVKANAETTKKAAQQTRQAVGLRMVAFVLKNAFELTNNNQLLRAS